MAGRNLRFNGNNSPCPLMSAVVRCLHGNRSNHDEVRPEAHQFPEHGSLYSAEENSSEGGYRVQDSRCSPGRFSTPEFYCKQQLLAPLVRLLALLRLGVEEFGHPSQPVRVFSAMSHHPLSAWVLLFVLLFC